MKRLLLYLGLMLGLLNGLQAQDSTRQRLAFSGQLSAWANYGHDQRLNTWLGTRYLPQANYELQWGERRMFDVEASANVVGSLGMHPFDTVGADGNLQPYRAWVRYSSPQCEVRLGLQKINFGAASMLRPLMWFDQIDPRDPLQLTNGVWGALGRYYFLNNANIWVWGLYGNGQRKGWERAASNPRLPELGGRLQLPIPRGELGLAYHHRRADVRDFVLTGDALDRVPEHRVGFDAKWDLLAGLWVEGSWTHKTQPSGLLTNQTLLNAGTDYTFGVGNGLRFVAEHIVFAFDAEPFAFEQVGQLTGATLSYPLGMFDNLSAIVYYDWTNQNFYRFVNWQRQYDRFTFYVMGYWNPANFQLLQQNELVNTFSGRGVQLMLVVNH